MPHQSVNVATEPSRSQRTLPPYLVWAVIWYAFFLFAVNVRVPTMLWEPVYLWVYAQVNLLEPATGDLGRKTVLGIFLAIYLILGCCLWLAVEMRRPTRRSQSVWKRAGIAWFILVAATMLIAFGLLEWS
jgi:hypothetical protein